MDIKRILSNDLSVLTARSNEGKTMALVNIILEYKKEFNGDIWVFGVNKHLTDILKVKTFTSLLELEQIKEAIVIIDEVGLIFDLENRKNRKQIDLTLRLVNHNGNKILLSGLPTDFKKYICAKAKCFMFKTLQVSDLINGSQAKEIVMQHKGVEKGTYILDIPIDKMLCYCPNKSKQGHYWIETIKYLKEYDTKVDNKDLFLKKCKKCGNNVGGKTNENKISR